MSFKNYIKERFKRLKTSPRWVRVSLGVLFVLGGILGALPVVGFWMLPLGLILLSVDFPWAKRAAAYVRLLFYRARLRLGLRGKTVSGSRTADQ